MSEIIVRTTVRIPSSVKKSVDRLAEQQHRSVNSMIVHLLATGCDKELKKVKR